MYPNGTTRVVVGSIGISGVTGNNVPGTTALCSFPRVLTISGADLVIADSGAHVVRVLYANQTLRTVMGALGTSGSTGSVAPFFRTARLPILTLLASSLVPLQCFLTGAMESRRRRAW